MEELTPEQRDALGALKAARGPCPSADALVEYQAVAEFDRPRYYWHDHIQICSRCQLALLHMKEHRSELVTGAVNNYRRVRLAVLLPIAAILVLGFAITMVNRRGGSLDRPAETIRGSEIQATAPIGSVDVVTEFSWQSPIRAERYRVTVLRGSDRVWQTETSALRAAPPSGVLERNVEYSWQVEAIDREGDVRMSSPPRAFSIR